MAGIARPPGRVGFRAPHPIDHGSKYVTDLRIAKSISCLLLGQFPDFVSYFRRQFFNSLQGVLEPPSPGDGALGAQVLGREQKSSSGSIQLWRRSQGQADRAPHRPRSSRVLQVTLHNNE